MKIKVLLFLFSLFPFFTNAQTPYWSEDFSNGFNSSNGQWTVEGPDTIWKHSFYGTSGEWSIGAPLPQFPTVANGFALFDADSVNTLISPNYIARKGSLVSPLIDVSAYPSCMLGFENFGRTVKAQYDESISVEVSADDGITWTSFDVSHMMPSSDNPEFCEINISPVVVGSSTVRIRFTFGQSSTTHYFWAIDDITLYNAPVNDIRLETVSFDSTTGPFSQAINYSIIPMCQVEPMYPTASVYNEGYTTQTNVHVVVDVEKNGIPVSTLQTPSQSMTPWISAESTSNIFNQFSGPGEYSFIYEAVQDEVDEKPATNFDTISFEISDNLYARDRRYNGGYGPIAGNNGYLYPFQMGNLFKITEYASPIEIIVYIDLSTVTGAIAYGAVNSYDPSTGAITLLGQTPDHIVTAQDIADGWITLEFVDTIHFQAGQYILATVGASSTHDELSVGHSRYSGEPACFMYNDITATWTSLIYAPMVRMRLNDCFIGIDDISFADVELFPNPNQGAFTISGMKPGTKVDVYNSLGALVLSDQVNIDQMSYQTSGLATGVYYVRLMHEETFKSIKMIID